MNFSGMSLDRAFPLSPLSPRRLYIHNNPPDPANTMHYKGSGKIIPRYSPFDIAGFRGDRRGIFTNISMITMIFLTIEAVVLGAVGGRWAVVASVRGMVVWVDAVVATGRVMAMRVLGMVVPSG